MDMEREAFINEILNSTKGMVQAQPSADLYAKIGQKIRISNVHPSTIWWVAASIAVLMAINISALSSKSHKGESQSAASLATELNQNNQLY